MMLFLLFFVLIVVGLLLKEYAYEFSFADFVGVIMVGIGVVLLVATLIFWPMFYYVSTAEINRYYALKQTIEESRSGDLSEIERAALTKEIAEYNKDLASVKYWNSTVFDIFINDKLAELPPLK